MESYQIKNLTFAYPEESKPAVKDICLSIKQGQFLTLCGKSGSGKSTLLRLLKPDLAPHGILQGEILLEGKPLEKLDHRQQSEKIGFVLQSPQAQIVTDKVWHELAFGLESLGLSSDEIRKRVAEMASFFGIQTWFHKKVTELSGGQKQILSLASVMVMQPSVLILDEPTSQLDPIAALDFLQTLKKINRELGTTILLSEHRLEEAFPLSDRVLVLEEGALVADEAPGQVGALLRKTHSPMLAALPTPMRIYAGVDQTLECPVTVREGQKWLKEIAALRTVDPSRRYFRPKSAVGPVAIQMQDVWFRYERDLPDTIRGMSLRVHQGEFYAIVGGNGTGKTTCLSLLGGLLRPQRGKVQLYPEGCTAALLPQNPQALFVKKTVRLDLYETLRDAPLSQNEKAQMVGDVTALCELEPFLDRHPYDLSGGEQQRTALAKVLLLRPEVLLLDEPTKGLDAAFKAKLASILKKLRQDGMSVIMVSHDIEFCAKYADRCGMFFDGGIVSEGPTETFFAGNRFYTTAASRMARFLLPEAILAEDVILACGGAVEETEEIVVPAAAAVSLPEKKEKVFQRKKAKHWVGALGFFALFLLTYFWGRGRWGDWRIYLFQVVLLLELGASISCIVPWKRPAWPERKKEKKGPLPKRMWFVIAAAVLAMPVTIFVGMYVLGDRKYYFISLLMILETLIPFAVAFEGRKPSAKELVLISVLCALTVAARSAFFMLPQFKPIAALIILSGVSFGPETGFMIGAVSIFVSNLFFGQGPWTPWQMFAFGILGFLSGIVFRRGAVGRSRGPLCIYGTVAVFFLYGGIMNLSSVLMYQAYPTKEIILSTYSMGIPFDLIHAVATGFFLWFLSVPMLEKLDRIKTKYGMLQP